MEMTAKDRKALIVLGAVALVALLLFVFVLRKGGGGTSSSTAAVGGPPAATSTPTPAPAESPSASQKPGSGSTQVFGGRDPFQPLVVDTSTTTTSTTDSTGTVTQPSPAPVPVTSPSPTEPSNSVNHGGHVVTLKGFDTKDGQEVANIQIDKTEYSAKPGQVMAYDFKLVSIKDPCVDILHVTHPITLCLAQ